MFMQTIASGPRLVLQMSVLAAGDPTVSAGISQAGGRIEPASPAASTLLTPSPVVHTPRPRVSRIVL
jgi:hypothetical protein